MPTCVLYLLSTRHHTTSRSVLPCDPSVLLPEASSEGCEETSFLSGHSGGSSQVAPSVQHCGDNMTGLTKTGSCVGATKLMGLSG